MGKLQIASLALDSHPKLKKVLRTVSNLVNVNDQTVMGVAIDVNSRQVSLLTDPVQMEDWLEDLVDSRDRLEFHDLKKAMSKHGLTKEDSLSLLLSNPSQNTLFRIVYRSFCNTVFNNTNVIYFGILLFALWYTNKVLFVPFIVLGRLPTGLRAFLRSAGCHVCDPGGHEAQGEQHLLGIRVMIHI